jgi:hypothetical protein
MIDHPPLVFALTFVVLWMSALIGTAARERRPNLEARIHEDFGVILAATLTLLGLIVGFSFAMAVNRYDHRKACEEAEASAIGTEYVRADLLPIASAVTVRALLTEYVDQRVSFYTALEAQEAERINSAADRLQGELWAAVRAPALAQPTPVLALALSGMNDVSSAQGCTHAAWANRIPPAAWGFMAAIAICCNLLVGYGGRQSGAKSILLLVLPLVMSISFYLIAEIDSPRGGLIHVQPQELVALSRALHAR